MDKLLDFSNEVAVITGAASGFGRLLALELAQRQCKLVLGDVDEAGLEDTLAQLQDWRENTVTLRCDVSSESDCQAMVDAAQNQFGKLTIGVNNAGVAHHPAAVEQMEEAVFDRQMAINVKGVMYGMKYQIPLMRASGGGHILNVSSIAGLMAAPHLGAYSAAKHAVVGLSRTAGIENGRFNIRVNAMCPYFAPTGIMEADGFKKEDTIKRVNKIHPMQRIADPQEIVNAMVLTLSPGNSYFNAQTIAVDGGIMMI